MHVESGMLERERGVTTRETSSERESSSWVSERHAMGSSCAAAARWLQRAGWRGVVERGECTATGTWSGGSCQARTVFSQKHTPAGHSTCDNSTRPAFFLSTLNACRSRVGVKAAARATPTAPARAHRPRRHHLVNVRVDERSIWLNVRRPIGNNRLSPCFGLRVP